MSSTYSSTKQVDEQTYFESAYAIVEGIEHSIIVDQDGDAIGLVHSNKPLLNWLNQSCTIDKLNKKLIQGAQYKAYPVDKSNPYRWMLETVTEEIESDYFNQAIKDAEQLHRDAVKLYEQSTGKIHESTVIDSVCFRVD